MLALSLSLVRSLRPSLLLLVTRVFSFLPIAMSDFFSVGLVFFSFPSQIKHVLALPVDERVA